jgi:lupus La protein
MWGLHTANEEHWVPIGTVATFKRMKPYTHLGNEWLVGAIREKGEILEVDEKGEKCRRTTEPKEITQQDLLDRSVYAVSILVSIVAPDTAN